MVNASLNWASIVGIVLAVGGALLFFLRNFKPALARDTDVFFAAIGLLCGGILFFQGWRLDPILQFGQFLLAGSTVFFAYESVRLRGVTTEQARRSAYFDDEEPLPARPRGGLGGYDAGYDVDRFDEPERIQRRIRPREAASEDDFYRPRRVSRAAIPERAASRRGEPEDWDSPRRPSRPADDLGEDREPSRSRYSAGGGRTASPEFGARRREGADEVRRGSRPSPSSDVPRSSRRPAAGAAAGAAAPAPSGPPGVPQGSPIRSGGAAPRSGGAGAPPRSGDVSDADFAPIDRPPPRSPAGSGSPRPSGERPRDNSSRFDD